MDPSNGKDSFHENGNFDLWNNNNANGQSGTKGFNSGAQNRGGFNGQTSLNGSFNPTNGFNSPAPGKGSHEPISFSTPANSGMIGEETDDQKGLNSFPSTEKPVPFSLKTSGTHNMKSPNNLKLKFSKDIFSKKDDMKVNVRRQGSNPISLALIPFPETSQARVNLDQLANAEGMDQVSRIPLPTLKENLESLRKSMKNFHTTINSQIEIWDNWKQRSGSTSKFAQDKRKSMDDTTQNKKKFKKDLEEELDNDSDYEEDIDNTEDFDARSSTTGKKKKGRKKNDLKKKNSSFYNDNSLYTEKPSASRDRRGRKADVFYNDDDYDFAYGLTKKGKPNFWADMEPYFAIPTQEDLAWLAPIRLEHDDELFHIPPKGKYYRDKLREEDESDPMEEIPKPVPKKASPPEEPELKTAPCKLTQKLLSALVTESSPAAQPSTETQLLASSLRNSEDLTLNKTEITENDICIPLDVPPTYDFSRTAMLNLEERVKLELKTIGLFGSPEPDISTNNRGSNEDELYQKIRQMQQELKEQVAANNITRQKLRNIVTQQIPQEERARKERQANSTIEKQYLKMVKKKKKANK